MSASSKTINVLTCQTRSKSKARAFRATAAGAHARQWSRRSGNGVSQPGGRRRVSNFAMARSVAVASSGASTGRELPLGAHPTVMRNSRSGFFDSVGLGLGSRGASALRYESMKQPETPLVMAARHVAAGRKIVARQREMIARLKRSGRRTEDHERLLQQFENSLAVFEQHERELRAPESAFPPHG